MVLGRHVCISSTTLSLNTRIFALVLSGNRSGATILCLHHPLKLLGTTLSIHYKVTTKWEFYPTENQIVLSVWILRTFYGKVTVTCSILSCIPIIIDRIMTALYSNVTITDRNMTKAGHICDSPVIRIVRTRILILT